MNQSEHISERQENQAELTQAKPDQTHESHWAEWMKSGISPEIAALNFRTIDDPQELDRVLNRNTDRRWKHSDQLAPGWLVQGVDPETGETTLAGCQYKPDNPLPQLDKDGTPKPGKVQKYLGASGVQADPLFLDTGDADYWRRVRDDRSVPILLSEGGKKGAAGLSHGYATIALTGVSNGQKMGRINAKLKQYCPVGRTIYSAFDNDLLTNPNVQLALDKMGRLIAVEGAIVRVIILPEGAAKGLDDFLAAHGKAALDELIENAMTIEEWRKKNTDKKKQHSADEGHRLLKEYRLTEEVLGDRLRLNTLTKDVELDGIAIDIARAKLDLAVDHDVCLKSPKEDVQDIIRKLAESRQYSPVEEYLESCYQQYGSDPSIFNSFSDRYFGKSADIYNAFIKRTLIAAVARVFRPGCKVDNALILQGAQGWYKSSFFRVLAGEEWFDDSLGSISDKDEKLKIHRTWITEWSELETTFRRKDVSQVKAFLSSAIDYLRPPYGRSVEAMKRRGIIVGTTNRDDFLADSTGNRRFWIIPVQKRIDVALLRKERDRIWAAAVALYRSGEQWHLTDAEEKIAQTIAEEFQFHDSWRDGIVAWAEFKTEITISEVLDDLFKIEAGKHEKASQMRVADILKQEGWVRQFKSLGGKRAWAWVKPDLPDLPSLEVDQEVDRSQDACSEGTPETPIHLIHLNDNFPENLKLSPPPRPTEESFAQNGSTGRSGRSQSLEVITSNGSRNDLPRDLPASEVDQVDQDFKINQKVSYWGYTPQLIGRYGARTLTIEQIQGDVALVRCEGRESIEPIPLCDLRNAEKQRRNDRG